jgi:hypothetical protein
MFDEADPLGRARDLLRARWRRGEHSRLDAGAVAPPRVDIDPAALVVRPGAGSSPWADRTGTSGSGRAAGNARSSVPQCYSRERPRRGRSGAAWGFGAIRARRDRDQAARGRSHRRRTSHPRPRGSRGHRPRRSSIRISSSTWMAVRNIVTPIHRSNIRGVACPFRTAAGPLEGCRYSSPVGGWRAC